MICNFVALQIRALRRQTSRSLPVTAVTVVVDAERGDEQDMRRSPPGQELPRVERVPRVYFAGAGSGEGADKTHLPDGSAKYSIGHSVVVDGGAGMHRPPYLMVPRGQISGGTVREHSGPEVHGMGGSTSNSHLLRRGLKDCPTGQAVVLWQTALEGFQVQLGSP